MITKYADLLLAALFALFTGLFVPFSPSCLLESINWNLLGILFCLMTITAEIGKWGIPRALCLYFFAGKTTVRRMARFFIFACFFSSMVITNDISLIIFVPFSISIFIEIRERSLLIPLITLETIAANMGSTLTPVGNPQNLFIYDFYHLSLPAFLSITAPVVLISGVLIYLAGCLFPKDRAPALPPMEMVVPKKKSLLLLFLLLLCILHVLRLIPLPLVMAAVVPAMILLDRGVFFHVDYKLLLLFALLFMAVGNLGRMDVISTWAREALTGREFWVSLLLSQFISNVPATVMLSSYTDNAAPLLLGVDIGGLGTLIASMASLISFKAYANIPSAGKKEYLALFSLYNLVLLAVLILWYLAVY
ncbi:SLC13 family permease [uncultured Dialister sp.]|jgi:Na+/H+ antiporter NhaD/arsenite permease-like protein|uniref:SLC13 family permease n=1 Tax=uncultured Dialister sp. TaxID=278064 RepID=UPI0025E6F86B|nr:SLC13 family permease [uncultured Dialister sp.]